jgi:hypothetical protein
MAKPPFTNDHAEVARRQAYGRKAGISGLDSQKLERERISDLYIGGLRRTSRSVAKVPMLAQAGKILGGILEKTPGRTPRGR